MSALDPSLSVAYGVWKVSLHVVHSTFMLRIQWHCHFPNRFVVHREDLKETLDEFLGKISGK